MQDSTSIDSFENINFGPKALNQNTNIANLELVNKEMLKKELTNSCILSNIGKLNMQYPIMRQVPNEMKLQMNPEMVSTRLANLKEQCQGMMICYLT